MTEEQQTSSQKSHTPHSLNNEEVRLWRTALLFLVLLATGLAALLWERLQPYHLEFLPVALLCVAVAFAGFSYGRRKRIAELKELVEKIEEREVTPTAEQLDHLGQLISSSQRSFKELIDSFDNVAFATALNGTLRTVNRRVSELLGISYSHIVGHTLDEFLEEPARHQIENGLRHFLEKRHWAGMVQARLKNNPRILYFDCVLNAIVKNDEVVGVSALARDVTEEREKEKRFTELFETLQEGVYFSTPEGRLLDVNPALVKMLGYGSKDELFDLPPNQLNVDPSQSPALGRTGDDRGGVREREVTLRRKDGGVATFMDTSRAVWDSSGAIVRYQGTLVDVTERRVMEQKLQRQEEFQRYLLESFPDLILVIGLDGRYSFVSSRIHDLLGHRPENLLGKNVKDWDEQSPEFIQLYQDVRNGKKLFGFCEYGARHHDGSWRNMRADASPFYDSEHKLTGVIVSVRDITVEKKLEQQIIQSERLAAMGQMIGGFAHELNNPLTSILGLAELLQGGEVQESARKHLGMLQQQSRRAAEIVQNLLYFSRPPAPGKSPLNLGELVQKTLHLHAYSLRKNNITVDFLPEPVLPPVNGDAHQLMQVFLNLILNAEQAVHEARDRGTLRIRLSKTSSSVSASFQDDGPGIVPEILPNIFDPFYTTKRPGRGTGLGLSISKAILREHGGTIEATSGPGGGAVFTVTLPIANQAGEIV